MKSRLNNAIALMKQAEFLREQVAQASELWERLRGRELIVSVVGQFKRGKSSLINALLDDRLLPVGIIPLTTAVTEIRWGDGFRAIVCFTDGTEREVERDELPDYISELKNPGNQKNVAVVRLWTEHTPFGVGITLVDTPGVGSIHQHNTETSYAYIEKSDAILFLLSVDSPVSAVERDFLLRAREHAAKFYFAVNKTDTISWESLDEFLTYCRGVLSETIGFHAVLYPISTKSGEGVPLLAQRLSDDLRASHDELLEASISIKLEAVIAQAKAKLVLYLKAAAIPANQLEVKLAQIRMKQLELTALSDEVEILANRQTERLVDSIHERLDAKIGGMRPEVEREAERLYEALQELPSKQFELQLPVRLERIMRDRLTVLNAEGLEMLDAGYADIVKALNEKAEQTARFLSGMVKDQFGLDYPVSVKEFYVSERSDFRIRLGRSGSPFLNVDALTHLLPKAKANRRIFDRAMKQMFDDLARNKTNMVYNYRYKMQESLRILCGMFSADIFRMSTELDGLLGHVGQSLQSQSEEQRQMEGKYALLVRQLDESN